MFFAKMTYIMQFFEKMMKNMVMLHIFTVSYAFTSMFGFRKNDEKSMKFLHFSDNKE
jgi:hypothetical protein